MLTLESVLKALTLAGSAAPAAAALVEAILPIFTENDQAVLKDALADARAANDAGYARLEAKLVEAAKR